MRLYRDIEPGEPLQANDERLLYSARQWVPVEPAWVGRPASADWLTWYYRRPVNGLVLQPVTPEAIAELERRHAVGVLVATDQYAQVLNYSRQGFWWRDEWGAGGRVDRPTRGWFIELAKLKEVQQ